MVISPAPNPNVVNIKPPGDGPGRAHGDERLVVAVEAVPRAALGEDRRGEVVGPIDGAHGNQPGDHQVVSRAGPRVAGDCPQSVTLNFPLLYSIFFISRNCIILVSL